MFDFQLGSSHVEAARIERVRDLDVGAGVVAAHHLRIGDAELLALVKKRLEEFEKEQKARG